MSHWTEELTKEERKRLKKHLKTAGKRTDSALGNINHLNRDMSKGKGRYGNEG